MSRTPRAPHALRAITKRSRAAATRQLTKLTHDLAYGDVDGIDGDVERLLAFVQQTEGVSRDAARAELVRRLSFAA